MTYAATVELLKETALAVGAGSFWHGPKTNENIDYNSPFPQVHLFLMPSTLSSTSLETRITLAFYGKDAHENGGEDSVLIQDAMDLLSQRFIAALRESDDLDVAERVERGPILRKGSAVGTGFVCVFALTSLPEC